MKLKKSPCVNNVIKGFTDTVNDVCMVCPCARHLQFMEPFFPQGGACGRV